LENKSTAKAAGKIFVLSDGMENALMDFGETITDEKMELLLKQQ